MQRALRLVRNRVGDLTSLNEADYGHIQSYGSLLLVGDPVGPGLPSGAYLPALFHVNRVDISGHGCR